MTTFTMPNVQSKEFQFARLIAEINAAINISASDLAAIADSMSLEVSDVTAMLSDAETTFENGKASVICKEFITGSYVAVCQYGKLVTTCTINPLTLDVVHLELSDEDYGMCEEEYIEVSVNGESVKFEAEDAELTNAGKENYARPLNRTNSVGQL